MHNFNIIKTLIARKNIQRIKHFERIIVFRINNKNNKIILKSNNFWVKEMLTTTIIYQKRARVIIHNIRIKSISKNIKKKKAKIIKKLCKIIYQDLKIKEII